MHGKWLLGPYTSVYAGRYVTEYVSIIIYQYNIIVTLDCGTPNISSGIAIEPFSSTMFNATIVFHCEEGLIPDTVIEAVCGSTGVWSQNPANHLCVNGKPSLNKYVVPSVSCIVPTDAHT